MKDSTAITAYGASLGTTAAALNFNEVVAVCGLLLAMGTFVVNWIYKHRHYQLALKKAVDHGSEIGDH